MRAHSRAPGSPWSPTPTAGAQDRLAEHRRPKEAGSAYLIALLVLVVLTILGMGLALITQTEVQLGANERTMQRLFYAADSGISRATAQVTYAFDCAPNMRTDPGDPVFTLFDKDSLFGEELSMRQEIETSPVLPVLAPPCPLCSINNSGSSEMYGAKNNYFNVIHAVSADAVRRDPGGERERGRTTVGSLISLQPWPKMPDCFALSNTEPVTRIKM